VARVADLSAERTRRRGEPPDTISRCRDCGHTSSVVVFAEPRQREHRARPFGLCHGCEGRHRGGVAVPLAALR
jgi:hypothetical protein